MGPNSRSRGFGKEGKCFALVGFEFRTIDSVAYGCVDVSMTVTEIRIYCHPCHK